MCFDKLDHHKKTGYLIIRIGIGIMFMIHGWGKVVGGPEMWTKLGGAVAHLGLDFGHILFGFIAALSEFVGGFLLIIGLLFRPACLFLFLTMTVAAIMHLANGDGLMGASHAIEAGILFLGLMFMGPKPVLTSP